MNYILFDDAARDNLLPLTFTRPVCELRTGILTIREKWEHYLKTSTSSLTQAYLSKKYPLKTEQDNILINGSICPNPELLKAIHNLGVSDALLQEETIIAIRLNESNTKDFSIENTNNYNKISYAPTITKINYPWDLFHLNHQTLPDDYELITKGRKSAAISETNRVMGAENVFIEEGATVECAIINAKTGPVYIGKNAEVMEGSIIRGPFALCEGSALKLGAKIYGPTTIGPQSKVGGEVNNSVIIGNSNKGHDGFLGNSVLGEWCNLGADTNNSNLKNNYVEVKLWNYHCNRFVKTGLQFCGLIMGDHSKCGINTMFNTGTVVGVSANIFGDGFPRNFVPSFSWGGSQGFTTYTLPKVFEVAQRVMERRGIEFDDTEQEILTEVYNQTECYRRF